MYTKNLILPEYLLSTKHNSKSVILLLCSCLCRGHILGPQAGSGISALFINRILLDHMLAVVASCFSSGIEQWDKDHKPKIFSDSTENIC